MPALGLSVLTSGHIPAGMLIAIALPSFAAGLGEIEVETSKATATHMSDTALELVSGAEVVADPIVAAWQQDSVALRLILEIAWARRGNGIAFVEGVSW